MILEKLKNQSGSAAIVFMGLSLVLITIALVVMEYFSVINQYNTLITELERAGNIAVEYSMIDDARGYHLSKIDAAVAQEQFADYFTTRLGLTNDFAKIEDGKPRYKVNFTTFDIDPDTPQITMAGTMTISLELIGNYVSSVDLPFTLGTRNVNIED